MSPNFSATTMKQEKSSPDDWRCAGWDEPVRNRMRSARAMTFREKLMWLESATKTARALMTAPAGEPPAYVRGQLRRASDTPMNDHSGTAPTQHE